MTGAADGVTLGTAGHIDHGKTALVAALTGVNTDRLPEERARGLTIVLGFAPLTLPSGQTLSIVDVPGHERFVRTMVSGATGIDAFLMVVAADDGVMPQTLEHAKVLRALGIEHGVVAVTKSDVRDPARAAGQASALLPDCEVLACSARTGEGIAALLAALGRLVARVPSRAAEAGPVVLHVDRSFTVHGRGRVVTGTLWAGRVAVGDRLLALPGGASVRVRGVQVHDRALEQAAAGRRVALNIAGPGARNVAAGDVLAGAHARVGERRVVDCALDAPGLRHGERLQVHHGTRHCAARASHLGEDLWQLRLERPLVAADGDRVVVRRVAPADTLGGGVILDAAAVRHGRRPDVLERLRARRDGGAPAPPTAARRAPQRPAQPAQPAVSAAALADAEEQLLAAGTNLLAEQQLDRDALRRLRADGRAVRLQGRLFAHSDVVADVRSRTLQIIDDGGSVSLAELRDELGASRRIAQAFLEHFDAERVTRRRADDRRIRARRSMEAAS